jgi:hypothetical protein
LFGDAPIEVLLEGIHTARGAVQAAMAAFTRHQAEADLSDDITV